MGLGQITLNCTVIVERWVDDNISHLFFKIFFFLTFLAVLDLCCFVWALSSCCEWLLRVVTKSATLSCSVWLLIVVASLVLERGLWMLGLQ